MHTAGGTVRRTRIDCRVADVAAVIMGSYHQAARTGIRIFADSNTARQIGGGSRQTAVKRGLSHQHGSFRGAEHILYMRLLSENNAAALV